MSDSQEQPWSNNANAPNIMYYEYIGEKSNFAGVFIGSILYGIVIVLSFQCMTALFDPVHRRGERIKWGLVSYTAVMFSLATMFTTTTLDIQSISYVENRLSVIPNVTFTLNNLLADGLLLYRCYFIYPKNLWVIAVPCLMYLGSAAMGTVVLYQLTTQLLSSDWATIPYFSISLPLNILLTLMIVIRLVLHTRKIRTAMGGAGTGGLCKAIVTMFIESCAINAVTSLLALVLFSTKNDTMVISLYILPMTQIIAPLFVIHRVANRSALTSNTLASGRISTFETRSRGELTDGSGVVPGGDPASSVEEVY